jgi:hypothetical protein
MQAPLTETILEVNFQALDPNPPLHEANRVQTVNNAPNHYAARTKTQKNPCLNQLQPTCNNSTQRVRFPRFKIRTQNPFEVNLTIVAVKIGHDDKWGCHKPLQTCTS